MNLAQPLGVLSPDSDRSIVVIADQGELAVALREKVDRSYAIIKDLRVDEAVAGMAACLPWPWMVIGATPELPPEVKITLKNRPIVIFWRGDQPRGLPKHTRNFGSFSALSTAVAQTLTANLDGMKLAPGVGVELPDGSFARSAELQALVASHPHPFTMPLEAFRSANRILAQHHIPYKAGHPAEGVVALVPK